MSDEVVNVASAEPLTVTFDARVVEPSVKLTVPVAAPEPGEAALTVAVKVATWVRADGLGAEETVTTTEFLLMVSPNGPDVLPEKFVSPPYEPVIEWLPIARVDVVNVALPEPLSVPVPSVVAPSRKVTVPLAVPIAGGVATTLAVSVTVCPQTAG